MPWRDERVQLRQEPSARLLLHTALAFQKLAPSKPPCSSTSHITFWGMPPSTVPQPLSLNPSLPTLPSLGDLLLPPLSLLHTKALLTAACTFYRNVIKMQEATSPFYFSSSRKPNQVCICISCRFSFPCLISHITF